MQNYAIKHNYPNEWSTYDYSKFLFGIKSSYYETPKPWPWEMYCMNQWVSWWIIWLNDFSEPSSIASKWCSKWCWNLWTTSRTETETTNLIVGNHATPFTCINGFQQFYDLIHVGSLFWICVPTSFHDICKRTRAASRDFRS